MSIEKILRGNAGDNESGEGSVELLAKVDSLKKGDVIILNTGEHYILTEPISIEDEDGWECIIKRSKKSGATPEKSLVSVKGLKDFVRFGRVKEFVFSGNDDVANNDKEIHKV